MGNEFRPRRLAAASSARKITFPSPIHQRAQDITLETQRMLHAGDRSGMKKLAEQLRSSRESLVDGMWLLSVFYNAAVHLGPARTVDGVSQKFRDGSVFLIVINASWIQLLTLLAICRLQSGRSWRNRLGLHACINRQALLCGIFAFSLILAGARRKTGSGYPGIALHTASNLACFLGITFARPETIR